MKIALCTHRFTQPFVGGVDVYADRLGRALTRLGHEVIFIAFDSTARLDQNGISVSSENYNGMEVWRLKFSFDSRPKEAFDYLYDPEAGSIVKDILMEQRPDLFIVMNFYTITLAVVEAAKALEIPVSYIVTDFLPICRRATHIRWDGSSCQVGESVKSCAECFISHRALGRFASTLLNQVPTGTIKHWAERHHSYAPYHPLWLIKPYLKHAADMVRRLDIIEPLRQKIDFVLAPNHYIMNTYLSKGFSSDQVYFLPFAVEPDHTLSKVQHLPASYTRFLFIGRFQPYKGAHLLIDAFNSLKSPNGATLTIYGTPENGYSSYFDGLKTMMNSNPRIYYRGQIAPSDLDQAFAEADYFVFPSTWHENSPLIILDALQSKTPIIGSQIGGITDIVKDGSNGLLFPMGDKSALQSLMQKVIDQPQLKEELILGTAKLPFIDEYAQTIVDLFQERRNNANHKWTII